MNYLYFSKIHIKLIIVALTIASSSTAAPLSPQQVAARAQPALEFTTNQDNEGQYNFEYLTGEGTIHKERGKLVPSPDGKSKVLAVEGEVIYIGDDNKVYVTKYSAGPGGTKVEGSHLPVAPATSSVQELQAHEAKISVPNLSTSKLTVPQVTLSQEPVSLMTVPNSVVHKPVSLSSESETDLSVAPLPQTILPLPQAPIMSTPEGPMHIYQIVIPKELMSEVLVPEKFKIVSG